MPLCFFKGCENMIGNLEGAIDSDIHEVHPDYNPSKIYLRPFDLLSGGMSQCPVSFGLPSGTCAAEYTDLSKLWHDASERPVSESIIVFVNGDMIKMCGIYLHNYIILSCTERGYDSAEWNMVERWAYFDDLLPKELRNHGKETKTVHQESTTAKLKT